MNKYIQVFSLLIITTFILATNGHAQSIPKIGDIWTGAVDAKNMLYLPPPYGYEDKINFKHGGVEFSGAVKDNKIIALVTTDPLFEIDGAKYLGKPFSTFKNKDQVKLIRGWGHYLPVKEGWYAGFSYDKITEATKVAFLFKIEKLK